VYGPKSDEWNQGSRVSVRVETIVVGGFGVNCSVCAGTDGQALVIDPGEDLELIRDHLQEQGLSVAAYLLTHGHCDHVSALAALAEAIPAPILMHPEDQAWAFTEVNSMPPFYTTPQQPSAPISALTEGESYEFAGLTFSIIHTPGHTPGGVCIHFAADEVLITGDTLFAGSVGRTDLPGGNSRTLTASLKKLKALPDATRIYPGHGPVSTIGQEKKTNYFMQGD